MLTHSADRCPYDAPSPALLKGAIGWRYVKTDHPSEPTKWYPKGWEIIYPNSVLEVDYKTRLAVRESSLYSPNAG